MQYAPDSKLVNQFRIFCAMLVVFNRFFPLMVSCDTDMTSHKGPRGPDDGAKNAGELFLLNETIISLNLTRIFA